MRRRMTIGEILRRTSERSHVQLLHECVLGAQLMKPKRGEASNVTRVTFATTQFTPSELAYFTELRDVRPDMPPPRSIGVVVWVPFAEYEKLSAEEVEIVDYRIKTDDGPSKDGFNDTLSLDALQRLSDMFYKDTGREVTTLRMSHAMRRRYVDVHNLIAALGETVNVDADRDMPDWTVEACG